MHKAQLPTPFGRSELPEEMTTHIRVSAPFDSKALRNKSHPFKKVPGAHPRGSGKGDDSAWLSRRPSWRRNGGTQYECSHLPECRYNVGRRGTHLPIPFTGCVPFLATGGYLAPFCMTALSEEPSASPHFRLFFQWQSTWGAHSICDPISQL